MPPEPTSAATRVLSPPQTRPPILAGLEQVHKAREASLASRIINHAPMRINSPSSNQDQSLRDVASLNSDGASHVSNLKKLRMKRTRLNVSAC